MDNNQTKSVDKHPRRSRWVRFLRGAGWTLLGLVALVLILAVLGMIIPPPRDPKAAALDNEDFGLGFKVGDKWDVQAMDASLSALGFQRNIDTLSEIAAEETKEVEYPFYSTSWFTQDGRMQIYVASRDKSDDTIVGDITINSFARTDWTREEARAFRKAIELKYPDQEARTAFLSRTYAEEAAKLYPNIATDIGLGIGANFQDFISKYGTPDDRFPADYPTSQLAFYFRDRLGIALSLSDGTITSIMIFKYPFLEITGRLACWLNLISAHLLACEINNYKSDYNETK